MGIGAEAVDALLECQKIDAYCSFKDEEPVHTVTLDDYYIDQYEVTNSMYSECVMNGPCEPPSRTSSNIRDNYYGNPKYANYPVIYVNWAEAQTFCQWRNARLPTEAEWEKAARGGLEGALYSWGNQTLDCSLANYKTCFGETNLAGSYAPNSYGIYDMSGNVMEWVVDWYARDYYGSSPENNPTGPNYGDDRVLRGGCWMYGNVLVASRSYTNPVFRHNTWGFRCAKSASPVYDFTAEAASDLQIGTLIQDTIVRFGPGEVYRWVAGSPYQAGIEVIIKGRSIDEMWFFVILPNEEEGWINASNIETTIDIISLPVIDAPPTQVIIPTDTKTPKPQSEPASTPTPTPDSGEG